MPPHTRERSTTGKGMVFGGVGLLVGLGLGLLCGAGISGIERADGAPAAVAVEVSAVNRSAPATTPAMTAAPTTPAATTPAATIPTATPDAAKTPATTAPASPAAPPAPAGPKTSFGDGTYEVNVDIAPGTYKTTIPDHCYWERLSDLTGSFDAILANDNEFEPGSQITVRILKTDKGFKSSGCGTWKKAS